MRSYLGLSGAPGSGYDPNDYTVRLHAPGVSEAQLTALREALERSSPVGRLALARGDAASHDRGGAGLTPTPVTCGKKRPRVSPMS